MIEVNKVIIPDQDALLTLYKQIFESGKVTNNGPLVRQLEQELAKALQVEYCMSVCNGTLALHLAFRLLPTKGEVITTPFSCIASSSSILWEGHQPVFCDIDPLTLNIDPKLVEEKITDRTVAISGVHVFGNPCQVEELDAIGRKYAIPVIYDGAQAFGARYKSKSVFDYGDISALSLHAYKVVSSVEGGALFTKNPVWQEALFQMRYFGKDTDNLEQRLGTNAKMSELNAAFGLLSLKRSEEELQVRKQHAFAYTAAFDCRSSIRLQGIYPGAEPNFSYFPIILPDAETANRLLQHMLSIGIVFRKYFYPAINTIPYINASSTDTPISTNIAERILCIPIHSKLSLEERERVINEVLSFLDCG